MLAGAAILALGYFRYGPIRPAFLALQRDDIATSKRLIATIKFPQLLSAQASSYLHWIHGVIAAEGHDFVRAEEQMQLAIDGHLRTSNDRCVAMGTLAHIVAQNNVERAKQILRDAERIPHKEKAAEYLNTLKSEFESAE